MGSCYTIFMTVILKRNSINNIVLFSFTHSSWCFDMEAIAAILKKKKIGEH